MKSNLLALFISVIFSLVILEIGLRYFTPYPVSRVSNKIHHEELGYVMDVNMKEIDGHGFRNNILPSIDVIAVGDSHTYGFNVSSDNSWPKLLGQKVSKNVYNFGIAGYGILQYEYLINKSIELNPKVILLGLYLGNDLNDFCNPIFSNQYWVSRAKKYDIDFSSCAKPINVEHASSAAENNMRGVSIKRWLKDNLATTSIAWNYYSNYYTLKRVEDYNDSTIKNIEDDEITDGIVINKINIKTVIRYKRIRTRGYMMDISNPHIQAAFEALKKILFEAKRNAELSDIRFGVLFIPSRERVHYKYLLQMDYGIPEEYKGLVDNEDGLKENISSFLENTGIAYVDVLPDMESALVKHGNIYPVLDEHPIEIGHKIYAENAFKLYQKIVK